METARLRSKVILAVLSLSAVALSGCSAGTGDSSAPGTITVLGYPNQVQDLLLTIGQDEGFFDKAGVTVDTADYPTSLEPGQAVKATKSDVLQMTAGSLMSSWQNGGDMRFFCGLMPSIPNEIMAAPNSELPSTESGATWQDVLQSLEGKKVGFPQPEGTGWWKVFAAAMNEAGVAEQDFVTINVGTNTSSIQQLLESGQIDAAMVSSSGTQILKESGKAKTLMPLQEGPPVYTQLFGAGYAAPSTELEERPEDFKAFCDAITEALNFVRDPANLPAAAGTLSEMQGIPPAAAEAVLAEVYPIFDVALPADRLQRTIDYYAENGVIEPSPLPTVEDLVVDVNG
ncbi:ABC transporter substrate-binding protein [Gordonia McavH-238-E]|uniref:ABC transporter substrate-binding protein n=1 Tax=Gordonia sp. McavH-238-E TaxID=2917736 RepID=UPI001EF4D68F|nr:ABC transporter substrate-binding protein [Gordonia sp. McavH-238-E]MCG7632834.1 ABC transporter substrate-binding protein [Gordonia sp. McavH-238-E]